MTAVGSFRSGKGGRVRVGTTNCKMKKWTVTESGVKLDTTNFECYTELYGFTGPNQGRSFTQGLIGTETATFTIDGNWDAAQNPFSDPPALYAREDGPDIKMYVNRADDRYYRFPDTLLTQAVVDCSVEGLVTFNLSGQNQGPYTRPGQ